jgi:hypothetical protein
VLGQCLPLRAVADPHGFLLLAADRSTLSQRRVAGDLGPAQVRPAGPVSAHLPVLIDDPVLIDARAH